MRNVYIYIFILRYVDQDYIYKIIYGPVARDMNNSSWKSVEIFL